MSESRTEPRRGPRTSLKPIPLTGVSGRHTSHPQLHIHQRHGGTEDNPNYATHFFFFGHQRIHCIGPEETCNGIRSSAAQTRPENIQ